MLLGRITTTLYHTITRGPLATVYEGKKNIVTWKTPPALLNLELFFDLYQELPTKDEVTVSAQMNKSFAAVDEAAG